VGAVKEFITAVEKAEEEQEPDLIFTIDGQELKAFKPTEGQFALLMMAMGRHASNTEQYAGVVDFFFNVLDAPGQKKTAPTSAEIAAEGDDFMATMAMHQARKAG
jgi:ferritin-like metal-binding protein YciE